MSDNCRKCDTVLLVKEPGYPGQSAPTLCDKCFNIEYPKFSQKYISSLRTFSNERIRNIVRLRPDGQCFWCGLIKKELMEDPEKPWFIPYIYCDECYETLLANNEKKGRYSI